MIEIGVIIPHFNSVPSLLKLINSITQDELFQKMIIVIIDDKSDDDLLELKKYISDFNNVILLSNNSNMKGAGTCRNIGLDYLNNKTKWLLFADADDYFERNYGRVLAKSIKNDKDADIIFYNSVSRDMYSDDLSDRHMVTNSLVNSYINQPTLENKIKIKYHHFVPWSKLFKSELIYQNNIRFDEVIVANDVMFSMRTSYHAEHIKGNSDEIYCVTKSSGSLTTTISEQNYSIRSDILIRRHNYLQTVLNDEEMKFASMYTSVWIFKGLYVYKLKKKVVFSYLVQFRKNGMKFLPPLNKIFNLKKVLKNINNEKKYRMKN